jgi:hypothetical protein
MEVGSGESRWLLGRGRRTESRQEMRLSKAEEILRRAPLTPQTYPISREEPSEMHLHQYYLRSGGSTGFHGT